MLCILYITAIGFLLGIVSMLVERVLPVAVPRRIIWCLAIPLSVGLPLYYRFRNVFAVHEGPNAARYAGLDPEWLRRVDALGFPISLGWLVASAFVLIWVLVNAGWVAHIVRLSRASGRNPRPRIVDGVPVVVTESLGPATVGLWRSRIVLPNWVLELPDASRQYIVRHEDEHRRSHDGLLLFVSSLSVILLPWNMALWWQLRRLRLAVEIDCDTRVVTALGDARAYGNMLLTVAQASSRGPRAQPALLGGLGMLERRLTELLAPTRARGIQRLLLPIAAVVLFIIVLAAPHPLVAHNAGAPAERSVSTVAGTH